MSGFVKVSNGCWLWIGPRFNTGYGQFCIGYQKFPAHRWLYGEVPTGKELHHLCKNRRCVNPDHMQALTRKEHIAIEPRGGFNETNKAKTHCKNGHPFDKNNTYNWRGHRFCIRCNNDASAKYRTRKNATGNRIGPSNDRSQHPGNASERLSPKTSSSRIIVECPEITQTKTFQKKKLQIMAKTRGRPKGSKNQPTLFPLKKKEATFLSIPTEILARISTIAAESKYTKQQVLEDILKNGLFTVLKMYRGVIETRKALDSALQAEKEEHEKPSKPSTRVEPKAVEGDSANGLTPGAADGTTGGDTAIRRVEAIPAEPDFAPVRSGLEETAGADIGESAGVDESLREAIPFE